MFTFPTTVRKRYCTMLHVTSRNYCQAFRQFLQFSFLENPPGGSPRKVVKTKLFLSAGYGPLPPPRCPYVVKQPKKKTFSITPMLLRLNPDDGIVINFPALHLYALHLEGQYYTVPLSDHGQGWPPVHIPVGSTPWRCPWHLPAIFNSLVV